MAGFINIKTTAVPLPMEDIDTDQIIPARFLKSISKMGFGENLFRDWRYDSKNEKIESFVLNNETYSGSVLVAGRNFGCGSSREHAAWAIGDYGFKIVISSFFADIFKNNALNNGILPITVDQEVLHEIFTAIEKNPKTIFDVNLQAQNMQVEGTNISINFDIDPFKKQCLLNGMDTIDYLISKRDIIEKFQEQHIVY